LKTATKRGVDENFTPHVLTIEISGNVGVQAAATRSSHQESAACKAAEKDGLRTANKR
jgi:hypothetical protein